MASRAFLLILSIATLFVAILGTGLDDDDTDPLYEGYNDAMQKRDDRSLMDFLMEKRGRGGSLRKCSHKGFTCTCDYRYRPSSSKRYANCYKSRPNQ